MSNVYVFLVLLCCLLKNSNASKCYSEFCQNQTVIHPVPEKQCLLTPVQRGEECSKLTFEHLGHYPLYKSAAAEFRLSAYIKYFDQLGGMATAFNLSVSNIDFQKLITRYQDINAEGTSVCRHIHLYGNVTHQRPSELFVSCPFSDDSFEGASYRLEYLVVGKCYEFSRKLVFNVPIHRFVNEMVTDVQSYTPFIYIDISNTDGLSLYVQRVPEKFNVTSYKAWLIKNDTDSVTTAILTPKEADSHILHEFSVDEGIYYFKVAAMHSTCNEYGCNNVTSPLIFIRTLRSRGRKTNCLLVYSPTHLAHVNVMADLSRYLKACDIDAMIDILNIPKSPNEDPGLWCNSAFEKADVVIVATSPPPSDAAVPVIYRNMDNHALRLIKENYPRRNKRYYAIQLPYCETDDIPEEARYFKRFNIPEDLNKFVRTVHGVHYPSVGCVSAKSLHESIKTAKVEISRREPPKILRTAEETENLIPSEKGPASNGEKINVTVETTQASEGEPIPRRYATNIDELNLLGGNREGDGENLVFRPPSNCEFRIDKLDL
ncbi:uncharacterized protein LOC105698504 isoform X2 [Orussus abietinus]|uniref:uncharacterized protein LOC105698504 isoform X2 n=1 Tax=Orussus abietinus TaxID=222816 RepID=UPI000625FD2A|nr:uncharacterized protein LOC105698504 isoform X2 [Orussus abietinus]